MRIIVVGAGKVGTALCRSLVEEKHDVILIEEKEEYFNCKWWKHRCGFCQRIFKRKTV